MNPATFITMAKAFERGGLLPGAGFIGHCYHPRSTAAPPLVAQLIGGAKHGTLAVLHQKDVAAVARANPGRRIEVLTPTHPSRRAARPPHPAKRVSFGRTRPSHQTTNHPAARAKPRPQPMRTTTQQRRVGFVREVIGGIIRWRAPIILDRKKHHPAVKQLAPRGFADALRDGVPEDFFVCVNHDKSQTIASAVHQNVRVWQDDSGLHIVFKPYNTPLGRAVVKAVKAGKLNHLSPHGIFNLDNYATVTCHKLIDIALTSCPRFSNTEVWLEGPSVTFASLREVTI